MGIYTIFDATEWIDNKKPRNDAGLVYISM